MADYRYGHTWPGRMNPTDALFWSMDVDPLAMTDLPHFLDALQEAYNEVLNVGRNAELRRGRSTARRRRPRRRQ